MEKDGEYAKLLHAMQTGVAVEMKIEDPILKTIPPELFRVLKHIRVGLNSCLVENGVIIQLLLDKGFITEDEFVQRLNTGMRAEVKRYEEILTKALGKDVRLG